MAKSEFKRVDEALRFYAKLLKARYKAVLKEDGTYASGETAKSISYTVSKQVFTLYANETLGAIDEGTKNYKAAPSPRRILEWMKVKGIRGRSQKNGRYIKDESLAFAISKSIEKNGTIKRFMPLGGGSSILDRVYQEMSFELGRDVLEAWHKDVMDNLDDSLPNAKKT